MSETIFTLHLFNEGGEPVNLDGVNCLLMSNGTLIESIDCEVEANMIHMSDNTPKLKHCTHDKCGNSLNGRDCAETRVNVNGNCMTCGAHR